jgi:hypothetical protein
MGDLINYVVEFFRKHELQEIPISENLVTKKNFPDIKHIYEIRMWGMPMEREYSGPNALKKIRKFAKKWNYGVAFLYQRNFENQDKTQVILYRGKKVAQVKL